MAIVPLQQPLRWGYDPDSKELVIVVQKQSETEDPDYVTDTEYAVRVPIASASVKDLSKDKGQ